MSKTEENKARLPSLHPNSTMETPIKPLSTSLKRELACRGERQESEHCKVEGGESKAEPWKLKGGKKRISTSFVLHLTGAMTVSPYNLPFGVESYNRSHQERHLYLNRTMNNIQSHRLSFPSSLSIMKRTQSSLQKPRHSMS